MRVNFKTLQQKSFEIDAEPSETVADLKLKIKSTQGFEVETQKLIYSGKVLADDKTLESFNYKEGNANSFIVVMVSKPKALPAASAASASAAKVPEPTPAPAAVPAEPTPVTSAAPAAAPTPQPAAAPPAVVAERAFGDTGTFLAGDELQATIQNMVEMGFERAQVMRALRASYNNPDRAVEYLMTGIPEHLLAETAPPPAAPAQQAQPAVPAPQPGATPAAPPAATAQPQQPPPGGNVPQNLFQLAQQQQQQQQQAPNPLAAFGGNLGGLGRGIPGVGNEQQLQGLREAVQQNPALLQQLIQQLAMSNPQLMQHLDQNPEALNQFLAQLGMEGGFDDEEGGEGGAAPPGTVRLEISPEDRAAIERLEALGFPRHLVVEAYFACDKNEELAANYLFEAGIEE